MRARASRSSSGTCSPAAAQASAIQPPAPPEAVAMPTRRPRGRRSPKQVNAAAMSSISSLSAPSMMP
jgi:hypothetical protein